VHQQERLPFELLEGWGEVLRLIPVEQARPRIEAMRKQGMGPKAIAHRLNFDGVVTPSGKGRWYPETVNRFMDRDAWAAKMRDYRRARRHGNTA
jgi:hypothetical protein